MSLIVSNDTGHAMKPTACQYKYLFDSSLTFTGTRQYNIIISVYTVIIHLVAYGKDSAVI